MALQVRRLNAITAANDVCPGARNYRDAFESLVNESLLCVSNTTSHLSPADRLMQHESNERRMVKGIPAAKQIREFQEKARIRLKEEDDEIMKVSVIPYLLFF